MKSQIVARLRGLVTIRRIDDGEGQTQAEAAVGGVEKVRVQTEALSGVARINDSGVRILHSARALRKVAVGK